MHGLVFDLSAYGIDTSEMTDAAGFTLKLYGSSRHRCMCLAIPKSESLLVKNMRLILDRSVKCFRYSPSCLHLLTPGHRTQIYSPLSTEHTDLFTSQFGTHSYLTS